MSTPNTTPETVQAVLRALLNPNADFVEAAAALGLTPAQFLAIAESPPVTQAIQALEQLSQLRARTLLALSSHAAIAALTRIATSEPETPTARETCRKAAAQILRMAAKAEADAAQVIRPVSPEAPASMPSAARPPVHPSQPAKHQGRPYAASPPPAAGQPAHPSRTPKPSERHAAAPAA
ncbi:MAG TPA: hypothetical protein VFF69_14030 [Phycisphaerales bacterium]|nr:hypothetical protein [Phycisphaerales bacterium]